MPRRQRGPTKEGPTGPAPLKPRPSCRVAPRCPLTEKARDMAGAQRRPLVGPRVPPMALAATATVRALRFPTETSRPTACSRAAGARTAATVRVGVERLRRRLARETLKARRVLVFLLLPDKVAPVPLTCRAPFLGSREEPSGEPCGAHGLLLLVGPPGVVLARRTAGVSVVQIGLAPEMAGKQQVAWVGRFVGARVASAGSLSKTEVAPATETT